MRFDNIGRCLGSCLALQPPHLLLRLTMTHVHTLDTAHTMRYADAGKYFKTCFKFAPFCIHPLYLLDLKSPTNPQLKNKQIIIYSFLNTIWVICVNGVGVCYVQPHRETEQTEQIYFPSEQFLFPPPRLNYPTQPQPSHPCPMTLPSKCG